MTGILLLGRDQVIESRAKRHRTPLEHGDIPTLSFPKTLITIPGTRIPWQLLPAAWGLLDRWDAAIPLWRYDATAASVGTPGEREKTQAVIRDLRVLLHAVELLFVCDNEAGNALIMAWRREMTTGDDKRLAFLRAVYQIKPRLCVLPTSWLTASAARPVRVVRPIPGPPARKLVRVELAPGRFVRVYEGDEERARKQFERQRNAR